MKGSTQLRLSSAQSGVTPDDIRNALRASVEELKGEVATLDRTPQILESMAAEESKDGTLPRPSGRPASQALGALMADEKEGTSRLQSNRRWVIVRPCRTPLYELTSGDATPAGRAMFGMLGTFSEFEREMIVARVNAG